MSQGLPALHELAGRVHVEMLDPSGHPRVHVRDASFVWNHRGDRPDRLCQRLAANGLEADVEGLGSGGIHRHPVVRRVCTRRRSHACRAFLRWSGVRSIERPARTRLLHPEEADQHDGRAECRQEWRGNSTQRILDGHRVIPS